MRNLFLYGRTRDPELRRLIDESRSLIARSRALQSEAHRVLQDSAICRPLPPIAKGPPKP
jgi:hypothetical protein